MGFLGGWRIRRWGFLGGRRWRRGGFRGWVRWRRGVFWGGRGLVGGGLEGVLLAGLGLGLVLVLRDMLWLLEGCCG